MISFSFNIANPWSKTWKNLWCRSFPTPFNNKFIELEVIQDSTIVSFMFRLATRQSHGGLSLELGILGYSFNFQFYDSRHWDVENNCWEVYGQPN
jgi:hypothetical protein